MCITAGLPLSVGYLPVCKLLQGFNNLLRHLRNILPDAAACCCCKQSALLFGQEFRSARSVQDQIKLLGLKPRQFCSSLALPRHSMTDPPPGASPANANPHPKVGKLFTTTSRAGTSPTVRVKPPPGCPGGSAAHRPFSAVEALPASIFPSEDGRVCNGYDADLSGIAAVDVASNRVVVRGVEVLPWLFRVLGGFPWRAASAAASGVLPSKQRALGVGGLLTGASVL